MPAVDDVASRALRDPATLAAVDLESGRRWTYAELDGDIARCATVLRERGCRPGDRVAAIARNHVALLLVHLACARVGAVFVPLNLRLTRHELGDLLADAAPALLIGDDRLADRPRGDITLRELVEAIDAAAPAAPAPIDPTRPSLLLFTSGTTGRAKGALLSERNLAESALNFAALGRVDEGSVVLCDAPMFHVIGLVTNVRPTLRQGGTCLVSTGFDAPVTLARLEDPALAVTHYFCVPQMAAALRSQPAYRPAALSRLKAVFTGGAPHAAEAIRAFLRDGLLVADGYGMTEVGTVFGMPIDRDVIERKAGSVGKGTERVATRIVDDEGNDCPVGTPGELLVRGANVFAGYFGHPRETGEATTDGWFRTGDICRVDADGFYYVVDRKKDMFISGGENVYPAEVEAALAGFPGICELAVVGVPDERWGEVGHLAFVAATRPAPDPDAVRAYLDARVARFRIPKYITRLEALPRTASGKIHKGRLRDVLLAAVPVSKAAPG